MKTKAARYFVGFSWLAVLVTFLAVSLLVGFLFARKLAHVQPSAFFR